MDNQHVINMTHYQKFIMYRSYSRYMRDKGRREMWSDINSRLRNFLEPLLQNIPTHRRNSIFESVSQMTVMPSMRLLASAGAAAEQENASVYNCAYVPIDSLEAFGEALYLLMCGCGVGNSVEYEAIKHIPCKSSCNRNKRTNIVVEDTRAGWAKALVQVLRSALNGEQINVDYSLIRPEGSILKTFGGRASGVAPLRSLINFCIESIRTLEIGQRLSSLQIFDICCQIAQCSIAGGTRRSASITLFDPWDNALMTAKKGYVPLYRQYANISAVITSDTQDSVIKDIVAMSLENGEPGIVNRTVLLNKLKAQGRYEDPLVGLNPCGEIILRPRQFCNLTEIPLRNGNHILPAYVATVLGLVQSTLTNFNTEVLSPLWTINSLEDRLLGVSLSNIWDYFSNPLDADFRRLKATVVLFAQDACNQMNLNIPKAMTTIKPSGTTGQLLNISQGIHPRYARSVCRNVMVSKHDPVAKALIACGQPHTFPYGEKESPVFQFLVCAPETSKKFVHNTSALEQLHLRQKLLNEWCDHLISQTIYMDTEELSQVQQHLISNRHLLSGLTFLNKRTNGNYAYMPIVPLSDEEANLLAQKEAKATPLSPVQIAAFETEDYTESRIAVGCSGGSCNL